ncbi:MAG: hypothetical protein COX19_13195 [Desulfobacterales bacterium CG23_combo_of_CG06-09_8_20_14_all_51_8]|nr:MAG: hypothetical protein COX19_13195 [Desulfobacterales bacterium CG23_combo_of_CG06-09_8_20_14_all_51_8]
MIEQTEKNINLPGPSGHSGLRDGAGISYLENRSNQSNYLIKKQIYNQPGLNNGLNPPFGLSKRDFKNTENRLFDWRITLR